MKNIVDGVGVSGCEYSFKKDNTVCCSDYITGLCEDYNCHYKQLQRLKQENKKLEDSNKNLKLALETYQMPEVVKVLTDWKTGELDLQEHKLQKYKQALEDIKEKIDCSKCKYQNEECFPQQCDRIQTKINEVLND